LKPSFVCNGFVTICPLCGIPEFGRFLPLVRLAGCAWPKAMLAQKPPSSLTRQTGSHTDGLEFLKILFNICREANLFSEVI